MKRLKYNLKKCQACRTCEIVCCVGHSEIKDLDEAVRKKKLSLPRIKIAFAKDKNVPIACRHCDDPKCVTACISCALTYDKDKKMVIHDKDKCVGCWMCVMACPYAAIIIDKKQKIPLRCDLCIDIGKPRCVEACPVKAIIWEEEKVEVK